MTETLPATPENVLALAVLFCHRFGVSIKDGNDGVKGVMSLFARFAKGYDGKEIDESYGIACVDYLARTVEAKAGSRGDEVSRNGNLAMTRALDDLRDDKARLQAMMTCAVVLAEDTDEAVDLINDWDKVMRVTDPTYKRPRSVRNLLKFKRAFRRRKKGGES